MKIFATPERIEALKKAIAVKGSHHAEAFQGLKTYVDGKGRNCYDPANKNWSYDRSAMASCAAFMYLLTGDKKYSELAYQVLRDIYDKPAPDPRQPHMPRLYGLAKARVGWGYGNAYHFCCDAWTQEQRDWVMSKINQCLDSWPGYGHAQLAVERGSNWVAVCRGGELMLILLSGQAEKRVDRVKKLTGWLKRHMQIVYGPKGYSQEGIGYTGYGCSFLLPACFALEDHGDKTLVDELAKHAFWQALMFHGTGRMHPGNKQRIHLMQGVGGWTINDQGWASAALKTVPEADLPYYLWFYDRHMGLKAPGKPDEKYDNSDAGFLWALLYYPTGVTPRDPAERREETRSIGDTVCGVYLFRNRWQDGDDILTFICTDLQNHRAWDKREATQIGLHAHGTMFFGGPCKGLGKGVDNSHTFSRVLIDGRASAGRKSGKNGKNIAYEPSRQGGYVIAGGGNTYTDMGADLVRHYLVDFSAGENMAILSTLDRIKAEAEHTYTWNGNLGPHDGDDGIKVSGGEEGGRKTFLLTGHNGWVKGWVLHPADAQVEASKAPLGITTKGSNADIWIVMVTGSGTAPAGEVSGGGMESTLRVVGKTISYDAGIDRITCK
jgi:hypothetical protein